MTDPRTSDDATLPRVVLMANVRVYRDSVASAFAAWPQCKLVGTCPVTIGSVETVAALLPDVVLLDATAIRNTGILRAIAVAAPNTRVVAFAIEDEEHDAIRCAEAGASGYVMGDATLDELVATLLRVASGEFPCSPRVATLLARRVSVLAGNRERGAALATLTAREREVLRLIDDGMSNKEIACRLGIGVPTVKNHVHHILDKTRAARRSQAVAHLRDALHVTAPRPLTTR